MATPAGFVVGGATNRGNNCVIHALIQIRMPTIPSGGSVEKALAVRATLPTERRRPKASYLGPGDWRQHTRGRFGKDSGECAIMCFTPQCRVVVVGSGPAMLYIMNQAYSPFAPGSALPRTDKQEGVESHEE